MKNIVYILSLFIIFGCKKAENRACLKGTGKEITREISLPTFTKLTVSSKIQVELIQGTENKLVIKARENLINFISHEIDKDGFLVLKNNNKCHFLRSYSKSKITVEVHFVQLSHLHFEGTYDLTTKGVITTPTLNYSSQDGGATAYLNLNCNKIVATQGHGFGDFVLSGVCDNAYLKVISNGFCNTKNLIVNNDFVLISNTPVTSSININGVNAKIEIGGTGNVNYVGTPTTLIDTYFSSGKLVKID